MVHVSQPEHLYTITKVRNSDDLKIISELFIAYTQWLSIDLTYQNFTSELASLPGKYSPPTGELLLARDSETQEPLGCIAIRPLSAGTRSAEIKRLYVTPAARGMGVGKALVLEILNIAQELGYGDVFLDTLSHMMPAIGLYKSCGFVECEKYYETPMENTVFLRKLL